MQPRSRVAGIISELQLAKLSCKNYYSGNIKWFFQIMNLINTDSDLYDLEIALYK